ncbi:YIP1 family protein [Gemmobacter aquarius]|uniref:YIP1 family protein n=1 Tax=Paragemmobacter aquarius TaxID=2169400 RepID=A0A2S0UL09_9RHOB|nr:YIP1 family protein [Gemmobacter aquarius]AWB48504.1 YIP1 family protein [Gemmobacter aquarius]
MDVTVGGLVALLKLTFQNPRKAAAMIVQSGLPDNARWAALVLMAVASAIVMYAVSAMAPTIGPDGEVIAMPGPFFWAGMVGFGMGVTALLVYGVGRWRGGSGSLPDAVLLVAWLQVVQLALVFMQMVLLVVMPPLASLLEVASVVIFLWLLTNFVAELHGFRSVGMVLAGVIATFVVMVLVMTVVLLPFFPAGI